MSTNMNGGVAANAEAMVAKAADAILDFADRGRLD